MTRFEFGQNTKHRASQQYCPASDSKAAPPAAARHEAVFFNHSKSGVVGSVPQAALCQRTPCLSILVQLKSTICLCSASEKHQKKKNNQKTIFLFLNLWTIYLLSGVCLTGASCQTGTSWRKVPPTQQPLLHPALFLLCPLSKHCDSSAHPLQQKLTASCQTRSVLGGALKLNF